ncbi:MAG: DUF2252 domain-containing protein [Chloroflexota bacterium]|nr:DUF2252 domain-containing protein [Chloroflexota bacterium]
MTESKTDRNSRHAEDRKQGKTLRQAAPRHSHGDWQPAPDRPDPISLLQAQDEGRLQHLLPIKYGRMLESPFAFLRGSAVVMACDLADTPVTGLDVILCGDAHISNFGVFASPERRLVFDINDFDESYPGPWEWDLKRLAASAVVAARENGFKEKQCRKMAIAVAERYRWAMAQLTQLTTLEVWYYHVSVDKLLDVFEKSSRKGQKSAEKMVDKALSHSHEQTLEKLTRVENGQRRIIGDPPLLVPFREGDIDALLVKASAAIFSRETVLQAWNGYLDSLPDERRFLLRRYRIVDGALRVGGVGSVGTRCSIVLLQGEGEDDALMLQLKEAGPSALEAYLGKRVYLQHAERIVTGQRLIQAVSDMFLGWHSSVVTDLDFYWRQLKDMKGSADVTTMDEQGYETYVGICSLCLARAHTRTGDEANIAGYIGKSDTFANAIADFAVAYADQTERDYQALVDAVESGRIVAETGI